MSNKLKALMVTAAVLVFFPVHAAVSVESRGSAFFDFGVFAYEDGDYSDAEANFQKALTYEPENAVYNQYLAKNYFKMERYEEAKRYLSAAWRIDPQAAGLKYDMGLLLFKMKEYVKAADMFAGVIKEEPENALANWYAGQSLYNEKDYGRAVIYFQTASDLSPSLKVNGARYIGVCRYRLEEYEEAVTVFEYVRDNAQEEAVRQEALQWLGIIARQERDRQAFKIEAELTVMNDSNVESLPDGKGDRGTNLYVNTSYNVVNQRDLRLGLRYTGFARRYDDTGRPYDLNMHLVTLYCNGRVSDTVTAGLNIIPDYITMGESGGDKYADEMEYQPELTWQMSGQLRMKLSCSYINRDYFHTNDVNSATDDLDGDAVKGDVRIYDSLGMSRVLGGRLTYEGFSADNLKIESYNRLTTGVYFDTPLLYLMTFTVDVNYVRKNYYNAERREGLWSGKAAVKRPVVYKWLQAGVSVWCMDNSCNDDAYDYTKTMVMAGLTATY